MSHAGFSHCHRGLSTPSCENFFPASPASLVGVSLNRSCVNAEVKRHPRVVGYVVRGHGKAIVVRHSKYLSKVARDICLTSRGTEMVARPSDRSQRADRPIVGQNPLASSLTADRMRTLKSRAARSNSPSLTGERAGVKETAMVAATHILGVALEPWLLAQQPLPSPVPTRGWGVGRCCAGLARVLPIGSGDSGRGCEPRQLFWITIRGNFAA